MENIDTTQIESYLRGKMTPEERSQFESALAANPELRQRTDELQQLADDLRQVARADLRKRVEAVRDQIKQEEAEQEERPPSTTLTSWKKSAALLVGGILLGLALGWLLFHKGEQAEDDLKPVAQTEFDEIYRTQIPGPQPGKTTSLTVAYNPGLDLPSPTTRRYKFYGPDGGLCIYARRDDGFWERPPELSLSQVGAQFFLKIGTEKFLLVADGEERPLLPEAPSGN